MECGIDLRSTWPGDTTSSNRGSARCDVLLPPICAVALCLWVIVDFSLWKMEDQFIFMIEQSSRFEENVIVAKPKKNKNA